MSHRVSLTVSLTIVFVAPLHACVTLKMMLASQLSHGNHGYQGQIGIGNPFGNTAVSRSRRLSSAAGSTLEMFAAVELDGTKPAFALAMFFEMSARVGLATEASNDWNTVRLGEGMALGNRPTCPFCFRNAVI